MESPERQDCQQGILLHRLGPAQQYATWEVCTGSLQGSCRFLKENKAQFTICETSVFAFDSFYTGSLNCLLVSINTVSFVT